MRRSLRTWIAMSAAVGLLLLAGSFARTDDYTPPKGESAIKVVGLSVVLGDPQNQAGNSHIPGRMAGTSVYVHIWRPELHIIEVDADASELTAFTDDRKTDLSRQKGFGGFGWLGPMPDITDDSHGVVVAIRSDHTPAKDAKSLSLKARIALTVGKGEETSQTKVAFKKGTAVELGPISAEVKEVQEARWGQSKMHVTLESRESFAPIKSVTFLDADGNEIKHNVVGRASFGGTEQIRYGLSEKVDAATIRIAYFTQTEKVRVPLDLTTSIGL